MYSNLFNIGGIVHYGYSTELSTLGNEPLNTMRYYIDVLDIEYRRELVTTCLYIITNIPVIILLPVIH